MTDPNTVHIEQAFLDALYVQTPNGRLEKISVVAEDIPSCDKLIASFYGRWRNTCAVDMAAHLLLQGKQVQFGSLGNENHAALLEAAKKRAEVIAGQLLEFVESTNKTQFKP